MIHIGKNTKVQLSQKEFQQGNHKIATEDL